MNIPNEYIAKTEDVADQRKLFAGKGIVGRRSQLTVAKELFARHDKNRITWAKIISIFAVCGGFAIDCVRQGHYDYIQCLVDGVAEIVEDDLINWLADRDGLLGLQHHVRLRPKLHKPIGFLGWLTLFAAISSCFYIMASMARHIGCQLYSLF
ncbi:bcl-2-related ovarian killer protein homolog A-like [Glossina fuscipes]|uniref:Bcl-2-related ovarian killer protein homolog A-like n=1 Tax=Glossina fuscipes TaxID=7396 RepID=A0A9C6E0S6_9MUSC|nr:bcl-2-related ovarian killer protein homolog A-like [Glossina fuscipes]